MKALIAATLILSASTVSAWTTYGTTNGVRDVFPSYSVESNPYNPGETSVYGYTNGVRDVFPSYTVESDTYGSGSTSVYGHTNGVRNVFPSYQINR
jgi:hypothetical protein